MNNQEQQPIKLHRAVIYCRVSGAKQVREGDGLTGQENRCREYAKHKGYDVLDVFQDGITGKKSHRPAMQSMLGFLHMNSKNDIAVIIDDISRLARGLHAHLELRQSLASAGGKLESPSIEFGEDSDSILVENLLASVAQHQREKNGEQTKNRMRGRMMKGYWVFQAPMGLKYERKSGCGKILVRDEPVASIIQEALEGYAAGRFETQAEITRHLEKIPAFPKCTPSGHVRQQKISDLLARVTYAGYIEHHDWNISRRKGHHDELITLDTYERIQARIKDSAKAPMRKDINQDFPLRGFVSCDDCQKPLTASWSTSGSGHKHPYYLCNYRSCVSGRKSIKRDVLEGKFVEFLRSLTPSEELFTMIVTMFKEAWRQRQAQADAILNDVCKDMSALEKQIEGLLDRIMDSTNTTVIAAYEKRIEGMENKKQVLQEKLHQKGKPKHDFDKMFKLSMEFLSNPCKIWDTGNLSLRRTLL